MYLCKGCGFSYFKRNIITHFQSIKTFQIIGTQKLKDLSSDLIIFFVLGLLPQHIQMVCQCSALSIVFFVAVIQHKWLFKLMQSYSVSQALPDPSLYGGTSHTVVHRISNRACPNQQEKGQMLLRMQQINNWKSKNRERGSRYHICFTKLKRVIEASSS